MPELVLLWRHLGAHQTDALLRQRRRLDGRCQTDGAVSLHLEPRHKTHRDWSNLSGVTRSLRIIEKIFKYIVFYLLTKPNMENKVWTKSGALGLLIFPLSSPCHSDNRPVNDQTSCYILARCDESVWSWARTRTTMLRARLILWKHSANSGGGSNTENRTERERWCHCDFSFSTSLRLKVI